MFRKLQDLIDERYGKRRFSSRNENDDMELIRVERTSQPFGRMVSDKCVRMKQMNEGTNM